MNKIKTALIALSLCFSSVSFAGKFDDIPGGKTLEKAMPVQCFEELDFGNPPIPIILDERPRLKGKVDAAFALPVATFEDRNGPRVPEFTKEEWVAILTGQAKVYSGVGAVALQIDSHTGLNKIDEREIKKLYRHSKRIYSFFERKYGEPEIENNFWVWRPMTKSNEDVDLAIHMATYGKGMAVYISCFEL